MLIGGVAASLRACSQAIFVPIPLEELLERVDLAGYTLIKWRLSDLHRLINRLALRWKHERESDEGLRTLCVGEDVCGVRARRKQLNTDKPTGHLCAGSNERQLLKVDEYQARALLLLVLGAVIVPRSFRRSTCKHDVIGRARNRSFLSAECKQVRPLKPLQRRVEPRQSCRAKDSAVVGRDD